MLFQNQERQQKLLIAFRILKQFMEEKYGEDAKNRIICHNG